MRRPRIIKGPQLAISQLLLLTALLGLSLLVLGLWRRSATPIDLIAMSDVVTLRSGSDAVEFPPFLISKLTVIASGKIEGLSDTVGFDSFANFEAASPIPSTNVPAVTLSLSGVRLSPNSDISLRRYPGSDNTFELSIADISNAPATLTLFAQGALKISTEAANRQEAFDPPATLQMESLGPSLTLRFTLAEREWSTQQPLPLSRLDFRDSDADGRVSSIFSSLRTGSVRFRGH